MAAKGALQDTARSGVRVVLPSRGFIVSTDESHDTRDRLPIQPHRLDGVGPARSPAHSGRTLGPSRPTVADMRPTDHLTARAARFRRWQTQFQLNFVARSKSSLQAGSHTRARGSSRSSSPVDGPALPCRTGEQSTTNSKTVPMVWCRRGLRRRNGPARLECM